MESTTALTRVPEVRGVPVSAIVEHFGLEVVTDAGVDLGRRVVRTAEVNRPGLQWAGYSDRFPRRRVQLIGRAEVGYLMSLDDDQRWERLEQFTRMGVPAVIVTRGLRVDPWAIELANLHAIPVLRTPMPTTDFAGSLHWFLALELAPRTLMHAGLVDVAGEGVLILGRSGVGKSETALELIRRGHRLIADDTVELRRPSARDLIGRAPGRMRHFMEVKGIGIVNLRLMFGVGSVKASGEVSMVVSLEPLDPARDYAAEPTRMELIGVVVPHVTIPVRPGRNVAVLVETAAMRVRARRLMGHSDAEGAELRSDVFGRMR
jgi:HPr kinase/phosphorylase